MRSSAVYLIRFDDICPTMNWSVWEQIETILLENSIRPFMAVVPDNQDSKLKIENANPEFWNRVRQWQSWYWTIGLHGYQHIYETKCAGILNVPPKSEFAGLPYEQQKEKLVQGVRVFDAQGVTPDVWIAPSHTFDKNTLKGLKEVDIHIVSDGFSICPYVCDEKMFWIPQQMWNGFSMRHWGVWTVCYHHNDWTQKDLQVFKNQILQFRDHIVGIEHIVARYEKRKQSMGDRAFSHFALMPQKLRSLKRQLRR